MRMITGRRRAGLVLGLTAAGVLLLSRPAGTAATVRAVNGKGLRNAVLAQKGKVTVVNLWATWCGPCVDEFPDLVKLHNTYKGKGLRFVSVSVDEPEDQRKVVAFINRHRASFPVYMRRGGTEVEDFITPLDKSFGGSIPVTYLFNSRGQRVGSPIVGSRSYAQFVAAVKPHL